MTNETLIPIVDAVERSTGRRPHLCTVLRWCTKGAKGIRLESRVLGGRRLTSVEAVARYVDACTIASTGGKFDPAPTPKERDARAEKVAKKLAARLAK